MAIDNLKGTMLNGVDISGDIVGFYSDGMKLHGLYAKFMSGMF